eukprot:12058563-Heterocapsa_arctica.AAC.1
MEHSSRAQAQSVREPAVGDFRPEPTAPPRPLNPVAPKPRHHSTPAFGTATIHGFGATQAASDPNGHGSGSASHCMTMLKTLRAEGEHVPTAHSG